MPYINIIIPAKYKIPSWATGVYYFDTFDSYSTTGYIDNTFFLNKNVLGFENKFFTGKKNGYVFYNHYYIYDNFEQYPTGTLNNFSGTYVSGYFSLYNFIQGVHNISGVY